MDHRPPIPPVPQPVAPALQRPYEPPPLLGHPYDTFNGLTAAVAAQMPVQPPPMAIQTALPPLGGQPVPLKRPAPESTQKKKKSEEALGRVHELRLEARHAVRARREPTDPVPGLRPL